MAYCTLTKGTEEHAAWHQGYTEGEADSGRIAFRVYIYLGAEEYGNDLMWRIADQYAAQSDKRPLVVEVHEHGGWVAVPISTARRASRTGRYAEPRTTWPA